MGRPSDFTQELADEICRRIAEGESLRSICEPEGMPAPSTVCLWVVSNASFSEQYARARDAQADHYADEIVSIADTEADPAKARVRVDARKWVASKLKPKRYGEKVELEHGGSVEIREVRRVIVDPDHPNG